MTVISSTPTDPSNRDKIVSSIVNLWNEEIRPMLEDELDKLGEKGAQARPFLEAYTRRLAESTFARQFGTVGGGDPEALESVRASLESFGANAAANRIKKALLDGFMRGVGFLTALL